MEYESTAVKEKLDAKAFLERKAAVTAKLTQVKTALKQIDGKECIAVYQTRLIIAGIVGIACVGPIFTKEIDADRWRLQQICSPKSQWVVARLDLDPIPNNKPLDDRYMSS
jgi:hypothetical protein